MARKAAAGAGTIRKKTVTRSGKQYVYWEARYSVGFDPGTGKQIQKSITGKSQKEVAQKLKAATASIDAGTYILPNKMTVGQWLDIWQRDYLGGVKASTAFHYGEQIRLYLKPALGAVKLEALNTHTIQHFYNRLSAERANGKPGLSPKSVKNIHGLWGRVRKDVRGKQGETPAFLLPLGRCALAQAPVTYARRHESDEISRRAGAGYGGEFHGAYLPAPRLAVAWGKHPRLARGGPLLKGKKYPPLNNKKEPSRCQQDGKKKA